MLHRAETKSILVRKREKITIDIGGRSDPTADVEKAARPATTCASALSSDQDAIHEDTDTPFREDRKDAGADTSLQVESSKGKPKALEDDPRPYSCEQPRKLQLQRYMFSLSQSARLCGILSSLPSVSKL